jgi:dimethylaniline monooxygenase (N-oxide forming)
MTVMHATQFKNKFGRESEFNKSATRPEGSTVVVLGAGETGHDVAYCAVRNSYVKRVVMCHRDGFFIAPKIVPWPILFNFWGRPNPGLQPNKPIDTSIASLFDTMYVPPVIQHSQMLWEVYDKWIKGIFAAICGSSKGIDQWAGGINPERYHIDSRKLKNLLPPRSRKSGLT